MGGRASKDVRAGVEWAWRWCATSVNDVGEGGSSWHQCCWHHAWLPALALQDSVHDQELLNTHPPEVVFHSQRPQAQVSHDALGCVHPMELDIWHAEHYHWWPGDEVEAVWDGCKWMGDSSSAVPGSKVEFSYLVWFLHSFCLDLQKCDTFLSHNGILNIATIIPAMDHINEVLAINALDTWYSLSIQAALTMGKKTLNHYYSKTDLSEVYRIAMGMYLLFYNIIHSVNCFPSSPPLAQATVFLKCWLDRRMDCNVTENCLRLIWRYIQGCFSRWRWWDNWRGVY